MSFQEFRESEYNNALISEGIELTYWDEKGEKLRHRSYKEACQIWWNKLTTKNKKIIQQIPNFDPDVFLDITGIDIKGDNK